MSKSIKLEEDIYLDSSSVVKDNTNLSDYFKQMFKVEQVHTDIFNVVKGEIIKGSISITIPTGYEFWGVARTYANYVNVTFTQCNFNYYTNTLYYLITPNYTASNEKIYFSLVFIKKDLFAGNFEIK